MTSGTQSNQVVSVLTINCMQGQPFGTEQLRKSHVTCASRHARLGRAKLNQQAHKIMRLSRIS